MAWSMGLLGASLPVSGGAFDLLETTTLATNSSTEIEFTSSGTAWTDYKHIQLRVSGRIQYTGSPTGGNVTVEINSTGATYRNHFVRGNGSGVAAGTQTSASFDRIPYNNNTSEFGCFVLDIVDINEDSKNTTMRAIGGSALSYAKWVSLTSAAWFTTNAATSIKVKAPEYTLGSGTRISIYGVKG
jgi:hypothetical protein